jgi:hypothetical protein
MGTINKRHRMEIVIHHFDSHIMHCNMAKRNIEVDIAEDHEWVERIDKTNHYDELVITSEGKNYLEKFDSDR